MSNQVLLEFKKFHNSAQIYLYLFFKIMFNFYFFGYQSTLARDILLSPFPSNGNPPAAICSDVIMTAFPALFPNYFPPYLFFMVT